MKTLNKTLLAGIALVTTAGLSTAALADREDILLMKEAKVSLINAIQAAEKHQGGRAYEANLDDDSFRPAYEVSVIKDDRIYDVQVDAVTGEVLGAREDIDD